MSGARSARPARRERWYRAIWRWHFYAGLFCVPFVLWLSVTGGIYLFKPQIEDWLYAPYRHVASGSAPYLSPSAIAARARAAVPGSILHTYVLPRSPDDAVEVLVGKGSKDTRVWVHPQTGAVLYKVADEKRLMRQVFWLHGELLAGSLGSALVEIAACWTVVMVLTGLFLWWPRQAHGLAGVLWPRLGRGKALFWRDLHAVTGVWVSLAALFLIATGLPWAKTWGQYFREVRAVTGQVAGPQDWSPGSTIEARERAAKDADLRALAHGPGPLSQDRSLDAVVARGQKLGFAYPVEVSPPMAPHGHWMVRSQAENRPLRDNAEIAGNGSLIGIQRFSQRHWIDRAIGYGVAIHLGAWRGLANQLVNLAFLLGLVTLCLSSIVLWWRRRPEGVLGAPTALAPLRHSWALVVLVVLLALAMPLFGLTLALAVVLERFLGRIFPISRRWMGWRHASFPRQ